MNFATRHMSRTNAMLSLLHQCIKRGKKYSSLFLQSFSRFFCGRFLCVSFCTDWIYIFRRSVHVLFQESPTQSNMSAYGIVMENGCHGVKKGSQFQPLSNCTFRLLTPVLAGRMTGYLARAVHKDGNAK